MRLGGGALCACLLAVSSGIARAQATTDALKPSTQPPPVKSAQQTTAKEAPQARTPAESAMVALRSQMRMEFSRKVRNQLGLNQPTMKRLVDTDDKYEQQRRALGLQLGKVTQELRQSILRDPGTPEVESKDSALEMQRHHLLGQRDDIDSIERTELQTFLHPRQWILFFGLKEQFEAELEAATGQRAVTNPPPLLPPTRRGGGGGAKAEPGAVQRPPVKPDTGRRPPTPPNTA